ncbi:unnamed protein product, partial [Closterium sp. NIES-54]
ASQPPLGPRAAPLAACAPPLASWLPPPFSCLPCSLRCLTSARPACCAAEGRPIQFDTWLDDLQLYLLSDSRDSVSLFDHTSGTAPAPPATADSATHSQWLTPQALYNAVVARYSSPASTTLGCLLLPYLFPVLSASATVEDLVAHLRTSDTLYRAALPAEFLVTNQPPMFITLYFIVTNLPDSLHALRDHFLSLDPTVLIVDLLEQHLLAAETSVFAVGAAHGTPCRWSELLRSGVAIFDLDYDAIIAAMYALFVSAEGECFQCVPPDPGIEAAALGASESALPCTVPTKALHTFTLDSGASRCFFRDSTTLTPLSAPVPVRLADPFEGPVLARSSTVLSS